MTLNRRLLGEQGKTCDEKSEDEGEGGSGRNNVACHSNGGGYHDQENAAGEKPEGLMDFHGPNIS